MFFTGIILIFIDKYLKCPANSVEYRYLPRDFQTQIDNQDHKNLLLKPVMEGDDMYIEARKRSFLGGSRLNFIS